MSFSPLRIRDHATVVADSVFSAHVGPRPGLMPTVAKDVSRARCGRCTARMTCHGIAHQQLLEAGFPQPQTEIVVLVEKENPLRIIRRRKKGTALHQEASTRNQRDELVIIRHILRLSMGGRARIRQHRLAVHEVAAMLHYQARSINRRGWDAAWRLPAGWTGSPCPRRHQGLLLNTTRPSSATRTPWLFALP